MTSQAAQSPIAQLFIDCWREAAAAKPSDRASSAAVSSTFARTATGMSQLDDASLARQGLEALIEDRSGAPLARLGAILAVMGAIDRAFYAVHPRAKRPIAGTFQAKTPLWLRDLRDQRTLTGEYWADDDLRLIPRGPLLRAARGQDASAADYLADRFTSLTCAPRQVRQEGRSIPIRLKVFNSNAIEGVLPAARPGHERVAYLAIAEEADELLATPVDRSGKIFARYENGAALDTVGRLFDGLKRIGIVDLALAPELIIPEQAVKDISEGLRTGAGGPRLLLAGSCNTSAEHNGQPFNEATLINAAGTVLWRQRKLWQANVSATDAKRLRLVPAGYTARVDEDNASGDELVIADLDGFGRTVVFICQDIKLDHAEKVLKDYHPDWVLMPILDHGFSRSRWAHARAIKLSADTQCRFVAVTSSSLAHLLGKRDPSAIGMAVGPADPEETNDTARASAIAYPQSTKSPLVAITVWRSSDFEQFNLPD